jgi:hydroxyethylthiazole kinase-like uncharacterized protein yjeF
MRLGGLQIDIRDATALEAKFTAPLNDRLFKCRHIVVSVMSYGLRQFGSFFGNSIINRMNSLPANIYSVASVRQMDRIAIEEQDVSGYKLMQRAAKAAFHVVREHYPRAGRWQVVCGGGNNAGDGYLLARLAAHDGIVVSVAAIIDPDKLSGDAATAYLDFAADGGIIVPWTDSLDKKAELLVDAMLGSGLSRDLGDDFAHAVELVNAHGAPVQALDIPTGINADTGLVMGSAINADLTTTFVALKPGLFLGSGPEHSGDVTFDSLGVNPEAMLDIRPLYRRMDSGSFQAFLPPRSRAAHKGDFGHVLVVGGGPGMPGAAQLCAEAALRSGAGRVSLATHPDHAALIPIARPELMSYGIASANDLSVLLETADVVAFGPGLGQSEWAHELYTLLADYEGLVVWDADALNRLASADSPLPSSPMMRVITPHPGEAARLLATDPTAIQGDRPAALAQLVEKYGGVVVLKGAGTLVSADSGPPHVCTAGNPGMAAPGMGDLLTGVIAALLANGLELADAASVGVEIHARAGDIAAKGGERGMLASDLLAALRQVVNP